MEADRSQDPPLPPTGYEAAIDDPYLLLPVLPECKLRSVKRFSCCGNKGIREQYHCGRDGRRCSRLQCQECKGQL